MKHDFEKNPCQREVTPCAVFIYMINLQNGDNNVKTNSEYLDMYRHNYHEMTLQ